MSNRKLTDLINVGVKIADRLEAVGIHNEADLRKAGPVEAHQRLALRFPEETLPVCYYLYSFEGALRNLHWDTIGSARKQQLLDAVRR